MILKAHPSRTESTPPKKNRAHPTPDTPDTPHVLHTYYNIDAHARTEVCALNLGIVTYIRTATLDRIQEQRGSHHFPILYSKPLNVAMARQRQSSLLN